MTDSNPRAGSPRGGTTRRRRAMGLVKVVGLSAAVLLVAAGGIWAVTRGGSGSGDMHEISAVDLGLVERGSFTITTTSMGEIEARDQIELRSELDTRADIVEIVPEGTVVRRGDVLVKLNTEQLQEQIDQQTLEVERAKADVIAAENALKIQLSENDSRERAGQLKVDLAELALDQWREGEVVKTRARQKLEIEQAERDLDRLAEKFERSKELLAKGFVSQDEFDTDEIRYIDAIARVETAMLDQRTYEDYQFPRDEKTKVSDVEEAKADLERIRTQNDINAAAKESSLATTRRQYELKKERLEKLEEQVQLATITAPTGGLVVYATSLGDNRWDNDEPLDVGREVRPNELLIILPDTSSLVASVRVHESLAGRIRPGQPASVRVDAAGDRLFPAVVESIGVLAESGGWRDPNRREYTVRLSMQYENASGDLKPSMRAEAEIVMGEVSDTLMVPVQSVFSDGPVKYVYTPNGARYERTPVQVGRMSDASAQIVAGIDEGQRVLLREPGTGEVLTGEWTAEQLQAVGVALDENGKPIPARSRREMMMQMMQNRGASNATPTDAGQPSDEQPASREAATGSEQTSASADASQAEAKPPAESAPTESAAEAQAQEKAETPAAASSN